VGLVHPLSIAKLAVVTRHASSPSRRIVGARQAAVRPDK
jgi:hypothetical protein